MQDNESYEFTCSNCGKEIKEDDDFCAHCGAIFSDGVFCDKHQRTEATGVCVVCGLPCCDECGTTVSDRFSGNGLFLCNHHGGYEIFEGMVKVYGTNDNADAEIAKSRLDEVGLHPALFRLHRLRGMGRVEYEAYEEGEELNTGEIKVMVPCEEVADAESVLKTPASS